MLKIVFVKDRHSKNRLAVLSTDTAAEGEEIYDMMVSHTAIVFMRYIMLTLESRNTSDPRTISDLFFYLCDEIEDIKFSMSLMLLIGLLKQVLNENPVIKEEIAHQIMDAFILLLPEVWKQKLKLSV